MKPNLILIANWITALRSGNFQQTDNALKKVLDDNQFAHCCLGVACEVAGATSTPRQPSRAGLPGTLHQFDGYVDFPPPRVCEAFQCDIQNLELRFPELIQVLTPANANDRHNKTFLEIADAIELHFNLSPRKS